MHGKGKGGKKSPFVVYSLGEKRALEGETAEWGE